MDNTKLKIRKKDSFEPKLPTKISTDAALSGLTFAFALIEILSGYSKSILIKSYQKNDSNQYSLISKVYYDQEGNFEKSKQLLSNGKWLQITRQNKELIEKLKDKPIDENTIDLSQQIVSDLGVNVEELLPDFSSNFQRSFERASELLYLTIFLERFLKLDTDQNTISFCYTLVRSIEFLSDFKMLENDFTNNIGKSWRWKLTWQIALLDDRVRKVWEIEEKKGTGYLGEWKKDCKKQATNKWSYRKNQIEDIQKAASLLRYRLKERFN